MAIQMLLPGFDLGADRFPPGAAGELAGYPRVAPPVLSRHAKEIGRAGELLVQSALTRLGERCYVAGEDASFDLLLMRAEAALRMQVKTTTNPTTRGYRFQMQRGYRGSPDGVRGYAPEDYDLAALVILPHDAVFFTAARASTHLVPCASVAALRRAPGASLAAALGDLGLAGAP